MITPEEFLESKGWHKDNQVVGGALWMGMAEMLKEYTDLVKKSDSLPCVSESLLDDMDLELRQSKQELPEIAKGMGECYYEIGWKKSQQHFQMLIDNSR